MSIKGGLKWQKKRGNNRNTKAAQHVAQKMAASTPNSSAKTNSLSEDDQKLLELAQKAKLVSESELDEFKSMLMDEYSKEYDEKKSKYGSGAGSGEGGSEKGI